MSWFASPPAPPPAEGPSIFALAAVIGTLALLFVVAHVLDYDGAKPVAATADRFAAAAAASASAPPAYPSWWPRRLKLPSDGTFALLCSFWGALALRCAVALWGHSGQNAPPMFGDFEAQRHWMEVTVSLPPTAWYVDGRDNDASRSMSREPGREGTEASEAWREAGLDIVGVGAPRRRRDCCWLLACLGVRWEVCRPGAASVVVRRFRAAEGQPRLDAVRLSSGVSQSARALLFLVCLTR